jgi:hypothetical protein
MTGASTTAHGASGPAASAVLDFLRGVLSRNLAPEAMSWLEGEIDRQRDAVDERRLGISLGLVGRKIGRTDLALGSDDVTTAQRLRARWRPDTWGADEAARIAILLAAYHNDDPDFAARVDRLCTTADATEHVACLKGFAVFPAARELHDRAREGVRSSARPIFEAIATNNPYPFDYFDDAAWNQMVVKCVFVECPIESIVGLEERRNPELVQMLRDFISERHAAGRSLPDAVHRYAGNH